MIPETSQQTLVVTGSASGIGLGLVEALLDRGCRVVLSDLAGARLEAARRKLAGAGDRLLVAPCDVSRYSDCEALWTAAATAFGRVDVWINNAGVGPPVQRFDEVPIEWIDRALDVNVRGVMYGTRAALRGLLTQGSGHIYNTVGFGYDGRKQDNLTVYGSTKAAVRYFTESTARELGRECPVAVSWINPGFVLTPMTVEENRRVRERVGEAKWRHFRRIMNAVADTPEIACPWIATQILSAVTPIDRLPPAVFLGRLIRSAVTRPDPLSAVGL